VEIHRTGASGIEAMLAAIAGARKQVYLETYILRADATGRRFFRALEARARAGAEVKLLFDGFGVRGVRRSQLSRLRASGVQVRVFNPLRRLHWRQRDHRKILVVDGQLGFTGGLNVADECYRGLRGSACPWRDLHLAVEGPAAQDLQDVFAHGWSLAGNVERITWGPAPASEPVAHPGETLLGVLPDGPTGCPSRLRDVIRDAIAAARRSVLLVSPYFIPGDSVLSALGDAVGRGVEVNVLVAGTNDHATVAWAMHSLLLPFAEAGVRVWEFRGALMHAKAAIFDDSRAIVGTSNFDQQSLHHSYEVNLVANGGDLPRQLASILREDLEQATPVTEHSLARRPLYERWRDAAAARVVERL